SFVERYRTLLMAKKSVHITNLHMLADETGLSLGNLLLKKRLQGLDITLYLDAFIPFIDLRDLKTREDSYRLYHNFMTAGIPVYGFRCDSKFKQLKLEWKHGRKNENETILHRHHEKLWITDNKEIIVGGANITNHYHRVEDKGRNAWRDQDIIMRGRSLVQEIVKRTKENMARFSKNYGDPRNETCFNPYSVGSEEFNDFFKENSKKYNEPKNLKEFKKKHAFALKKVEELKNGIIQGNFFKPLFHMIKEARAIFSDPTKKQLNIENAYIELIENSKTEILMVNSYSIFSPEMIDALRRAARRGVKIKILTNGPETNDPPIVMTPLSRSLYKTLTEGLHDAIEFYEWNGRENGDKEGKINFGMIHAKYAVFDRKISLVGSYNFDSLSRNYNTEMAVVYEEEKITKELVNEFYEHDITFSEKVEYADMLNYYRPRSLGKRILLKILKKMEWML
ncbi:MAG: phospholipase D-like domain-containing protein, partial [Bdellovibrionota bacterium]|nr:phospholipase D-like domain-containing protein [Bdellovibrionota bacterium]